VIFGILHGSRTAFRTNSDSRVRDSARFVHRGRPTVLHLNGAFAPEMEANPPIMLTFDEVVMRKAPDTVDIC